jgi:hypothetical protein
LFFPHKHFRFYRYYNNHVKNHHYQKGNIPCQKYR